MAMTDIFNLSFFIILGIMALFVSLLVVYFETKIREQNHKMSSMLSLVSTLAEDMNNMKNGMNYLSQMNNEQQNGVKQDNTMNGGLENNVKLVKTPLIYVSDNEAEESAEEESDEEESDEENIGEEESDEEESEEESDEEESDEEESDEEESEEESEESEEEKTYILNDIDDDEEHTHNIVEELEEFTNEDTVKVVNIHSENEDNVMNVEKILEVDMEHLEENMIPTMDDLKSISIHIDGQVDEGVSGETNNEIIDYKKLNLPKLRSIAMEKGLEDTSKLKKQELIELLENIK
jgi:cobalamin biosynthesis protein CobT